ncbi:MAG: holo-ACP synthase [Chlamydiota bacterium]
MKGIGVDIIAVDRIRNTIGRYGEHFLRRVFTKRERAYANKHRDPSLRLAVRFAAKEAVAKALGEGIGKHLGWHDIEILRSHQGGPRALLSQKAAAYFDDPRIHLSLSHEKQYAVAYAVVERTQKRRKRLWPWQKKG